MFVLTKYDIQEQKSEVCCVIDNANGFMEAYEVILNKLTAYKEDYSVKNVEKGRVEVFKKGYLYGSYLCYIFEIHTLTPK